MPHQQWRRQIQEKQAGWDGKKKGEKKKSPKEAERRPGLNKLGAICQLTLSV